MKKILPVAAIGLAFTTFIILQLAVNGQRLSASLTEENKAQYALFENEYSKFADVDHKGNEIKLTQVDAPIVILNFWASWCRPCIAEFKGLNQLIDKYGEKNIFILGINNDTESPKKNVLKVKSEYQIKFNSILDPKGTYADKFKVIAIPSTIVYHKGKVIRFFKKEYDFTSDEFISLIESKIKD